MAKGKRKEVYLHGYGYPSVPLSVKKSSSRQYTVLMRAIGLAAFVSVILTFTANYAFFFLFAAFLFSDLFISTRLVDETSHKSLLKDRVRKFVSTQNDAEPEKPIRNYDVRMSSTFINAVMGCGHQNLKYLDHYSPLDDSGNCQACKKDFGLLATPELNDYFDVLLKEAIAEEKEKSKNEILQKKAQKLELNSFQTKVFMKKFEDVSDLRELKDSRYFLEELENI